MNRMNKKRIFLLFISGEGGGRERWRKRGKYEEGRGKIGKTYLLF